MKIAYFDCFSGIAGDMALAALLDCGVPLDALKTGLASLPVAGWDISAEPVLRSGIHAQNVRITLHGVSDDEELASQPQVPNSDAALLHPHAGGTEHDHAEPHPDTVTPQVLEPQREHSHEEHGHHHHDHPSRALT